MDKHRNDGTVENETGDAQSLQMHHERAKGNIPMVHPHVQIIGRHTWQDDLLGIATALHECRSVLIKNISEIRVCRSLRLASSVCHRTVRRDNCISENEWQQKPFQRSVVSNGLCMQ